MSTVLCPLFSEPVYKYSIDLSSDTYTLSFRWNDRAEQWLMSIEDAEGDSIIRGVALVPMYSLISQYSLDKPVGGFVLLPIDSTSPQITKPRDIHKTHQLVYHPEII